MRQGQHRVGPCVVFSVDEEEVAFCAGVETGDEIRIEHYAAAMDQGRVAAANMLGLQKPYTELPFFWTMAFGKGLRSVPGVWGVCTPEKSVTFACALIVSVSLAQSSLSPWRGGPGAPRAA